MKDINIIGQQQIIDIETALNKEVSYISKNGELRLWHHTGFHFTINVHSRRNKKRNN